MRVPLTSVPYDRHGPGPEPLARCPGGLGLLVLLRLGHRDLLNARVRLLANGNRITAS